MSVLNSNPGDSDRIALPSGWTTVSFLDSVRTISDGGRRVEQKSYLRHGPLPVVDQGFGTIGGYTDDLSLRYEGPLPVVVFGDHTRRVKHVNFRFAVGAQGVKILVPCSCWNSRYFTYLLGESEFPDRGYSRHFQFIRDLNFHIPPLAEQHRIVEEIETQLTRLDASVAALKRAQANLKRYRESVLDSAVRGQLVMPDAELAKEGKLISESFEERMRQIGIERRMKNGKPPAQVIHGKDSDVGLPESWGMVTLGQVTWSVKDGPHFSPPYVDEGIPFVTGGNVRPSGIDFDHAKRISLQTHEELIRRCKPERGDVLYTKGGTTGIARVNTYTVEFSVWVHVAVLKLVESVDPFYVQHALNSPSCRAQAKRYTHGVGNQDLGLTRMIQIEFGLPSLAEQRRIVAEVERRLSVVEEMERTTEHGLKKAKRLRESILRKAFTGELVPQDLNDEPASVLLQRIKAERAASAATKPLRKPRVKKGQLALVGE